MMTSLSGGINNINSVNAAKVAASTTANNSSASSASNLTQSDFLQLLTAQLKYQSPTNPADPTQLAEEFASISTVDGIDAINNKLSSISGADGASQIAQASSLIGKQVGIIGDDLIPNASGTTSGVFTLPDATNNTTVSILNSKGVVEDKINLGSLSAGQQSFTWNGVQAGQTYTYQVSASDASGDVVQATPYTVYNVQGVNVSGSTPTLNVVGSSSVIPVSSVQIILGDS